MILNLNANWSLKSYVFTNEWDFIRCRIIPSLLSKEEMHLEAWEDHPCKPTFYRRYVDDVFALFKCEEDVNNFFKLLNEAHPNLNFTIETSTTFLPFLDTAVSIKNNQFESWVYRKPTNTGVVLNYHAVAPRRWKKSLVTCMLMRALRVSSSLKYFQYENSIEARCSKSMWNLRWGYLTKIKKFLLPEPKLLKSFFVQIN